MFTCQAPGSGRPGHGTQRVDGVAVAASYLFVDAESSSLCVAAFQDQKDVGTGTQRAYAVAVTG